MPRTRGPKNACSSSAIVQCVKTSAMLRAPVAAATQEACLPESVELCQTLEDARCARAPRFAADLEVDHLNPIGISAEPV